MKEWQTLRRRISLEKTLVLAILNITPDSFHDGGKYSNLENAIKQAEKLIEEGADILDIGGESTRPNSVRVSGEEEMRRVVPLIEEIVKRFDVPISVDTSKSEVAEKAVEAGAEIINDVSGLRFDENIGKVGARFKTGLILMHLRGTFETMHKQKAVSDILMEVSDGFKNSIKTAKNFGVRDEQICLDVGIGFSKTFEQNLELVAKLDKLCAEFSNYPLLVGVSRKSFVGKILGDVPANERFNGTLAANAVAIWNGANIIRVHDVKAAVETVKIVAAIKKEV